MRAPIGQSFPVARRGLQKARRVGMIAFSQIDRPGSAGHGGRHRAAFSVSRLLGCHHPSRIGRTYCGVVTLKPPSDSKPASPWWNLRLAGCLGHGHSHNGINDIRPHPQASGQEGLPA
jgi:hypothetical protein